MASLRVPKCARCRNHGTESILKGHKRTCKWKHCTCRDCKLTTKQQRIRASEIAKLRRREKHDGNKEVESSAHHKEEDKTLFERGDGGFTSEDMSKEEETSSPENAQPMNKEENGANKDIQSNPTNERKKRKLPVEECIAESIATLPPKSSANNLMSQSSEQKNITDEPINLQDNQAERYLKILCRLYPHQSPRILELILKGCDNDVVEAIESILPTHEHTGTEWVPLGFRCCLFPRPCEHDCKHLPTWSRGCTRENMPAETEGIDRNSNNVIDNKRSHVPPYYPITLSENLTAGMRPCCCHGDNSIRICNVSRHTAGPQHFFPHCY